MGPIARIASSLLELIAPRTCAACLQAPPQWPRGERSILCVICSVGIIPAEDPPPEVRVPYAHGGPLARAVHHAKYGDDPSVARQLGWLLRHANVVALAEIDCIVPVPLHARRLAKRGFNQALEMARALERPIAVDAVARLRDTRSQVGLGRAERVANVQGAFAVRRGVELRGRRVLVVDDVVTTGATLAQVVAAVQSSEPRNVIAVALARAPLEGR
jgi:ComF family protein